MDNRLRQFLDTLWGSMDEIRRSVRDVTTAKIIQPAQWKILANVIYQKYRHMGQKKDGQKIDNKEYNRRLDVLKKKIEGSDIFYLKQDNDHLFPNYKKGGGPTNTEFRVYINTCSGNVLQIASTLLEMIVNKEEWRGLQQFKLAVYEYFDRVSDAIVVYCSSEKTAHKAANKLSDEFGSQCVGPSVELAREIQAGLAIGESPIDRKCSFGDLRSLAIAKAARWYFHPDSRGSRGRDYFGFLVERALDEFGTDVNKVYRNAPGQPAKIYDSRGNSLRLEILDLLNHFYVAADDAGWDVNIEEAAQRWAGRAATSRADNRAVGYAGRRGGVSRNRSGSRARATDRGGSRSKPGKRS